MPRKRDPRTGELLPEGITPVVSDRTGRVTYRARYTYGTGGARQYASQTFADVDSAVAWLYAQRLDVRRGTHLDVSTMTAGDYFARWLARREREVSPGRVRVIRYAWDGHLAPVLSGVRLQRLTRQHAQACVDAMERAGLRRGTVELYTGVLKAMLNDAVVDGIIPASPATALTFSTRPAKRGSIWTPLQMRAFLRSVRDEPDAALWHVLASTGVRVGEALALAWRDVDLDAATASIHRTVTVDVDGGLRIGEATKTAASVRVVPLAGSLVDVLRSLERRGELVLTDGAGAMLKPHTLQKRFPRLAKRAGLPRIRIHDIRHSVASAMLADGVPVHVVQRLLGHQSIATTLNTYAHVRAPEYRRAVDALDRLYGVARDNTASDSAPDLASVSESVSESAPARRKRG